MSKKYTAYEKIEAIEKSGITTFAPWEVDENTKFSLKSCSFLHFHPQFDVTNVSWRFFKHCLE